MEERETENQLFPCFRFLAIVQEDIGISEVLISTLEVSSESSGRFCGQLDSVLQDRDGEVVSRHRCEEQAEVGVNVVFFS